MSRKDVVIDKRAPAHWVRKEFLTNAEETVAALKARVADRERRLRAVRPYTADSRILALCDLRRPLRQRRKP